MVVTPYLQTTLSARCDWCLFPGGLLVSGLGEAASAAAAALVPASIRLDALPALLLDQQRAADRSRALSDLTGLARRRELTDIGPHRAVPDTSRSELVVSHTRPADRSCRGSECSSWMAQYREHVFVMRRLDGCMITGDQGVSPTLTLLADGIARIDGLVGLLFSLLMALWCRSSYRPWLILRVVQRLRCWWWVWVEVVIRADLYARRHFVWRPAGLDAGSHRDLKKVVQG